MFPSIVRPAPSLPFPPNEKNAHDEASKKKKVPGNFDRRPQKRESSSSVRRKEKKFMDIQSVKFPSTNKRSKKSPPNLGKKSIFASKRFELRKRKRTFELRALFKKHQALIAPRDPQIHFGDAKKKRNRTHALLEAGGGGVTRGGSDEGRMAPKAEPKPYTPEGQGETSIALD